MHLDKMSGITSQPQQSKQIIQTHSLRRASSLVLPRLQEEMANPIPPVPQVGGNLPRAVTNTSSPIRKKEQDGLKPRHRFRRATASGIETAEKLSSNYGNPKENVEVLFSHPYCKVFSLDIPMASAGTKELLPFTHPTERLIAMGILTVYRAKTHGTVFVKSGQVLHPVMAKSQCWLVEEVVCNGERHKGDGKGVFMLRIRPGYFWRMEIMEDGARGQGQGIVDALKGALRDVLAFEQVKCPFVRIDVVVLGDKEKAGAVRAGGRKKEEVRKRKLEDAHARDSMPPPPLRIRRLNNQSTLTRQLRTQDATPHAVNVTVPVYSPVLESFDDILSLRYTPPGTKFTFLDLHYKLHGGSRDDNLTRMQEKENLAPSSSQTHCRNTGASLIPVRVSSADLTMRPSLSSSVTNDCKPGRTPLLPQPLQTNTSTNTTTKPTPPFLTSPYAPWTPPPTRPTTKTTFQSYQTIIQTEFPDIISTDENPNPKQPTATEKLLKAAMEIVVRNSRTNLFWRLIGGKITGAVSGVDMEGGLGMEVNGGEVQGGKAVGGEVAPVKNERERGVEGRGEEAG